MAPDLAEPGSEFPLIVLAPVIDTYQPPEGPFDRAGSWVLAYGIRTVGQRGSARVGAVTLARRPNPDGTVVVEVRYQKAFPGGAEGRQTAEILCRADELATPIRWRLVAETVAKGGRTVPGTRIEKGGKIKDGTVELTRGSSRRTLEAEPPLAANWTLFDAVQRLPREPFEPKHFTLLDDFDQPKPGQTLSFRKSVRLRMGARRVKKQVVEQLEKGRIRRTVWAQEGGETPTLHAYDHLGHGIVPWVYWVDDAGRLLFAVSGIEAYILEEARS